MQNEAELMEDEKKIENVQILDDTFLVKVPKERYLSPFILAFHLMGKAIDDYQKANHIRRKTASDVWPALEQLILHYERRQWGLFDKQFLRVFEIKPPDAISDKSRILYEGIENYGLVFCKDNAFHKVVKERIGQAENRSRSEVRRLVDYYKSRSKDVALENQLNDIRRRWSKLFAALAALYTTHYWNASKYQISGFTLVQKRFDELKNLYVDGFETFCRISVIAAGVEGINSVGRAVVPKRNGEFTLEEFDVFKNGSKPDILRRLGHPVVDLFVPHMDHRLRNGIGHNSAKYDVVSDEVHYLTENERGAVAYDMPYISFSESMFNLYLQLEVVSLYVNWVRLFYVPDDGGKFLVSNS